MPNRPLGPWLRKGRGYFFKLGGEQINLHTTDEETAWQEFYRRMAEAGKPVPGHERAAVSVASLLTQFGEWAEKHRKPYTSAFYDQFLKDFRRWFAAAKETPAADLRPFHVQRWIDSHKGWNTTTQNRAASCVKRAYSWAVEQGLIEADPIRPLRKAKARRRLRIFTAAEWTALLSEPAEGALRAFLELQRLTGARPQELRAAEVRHYDGKCLRFPASESKGGMARVIVLTEAAVGLVERAIGARQDGYVLLNQSGDPWTRAGLRSAIRRMVKLTGIEFDSYTLRHTYATEGIENGVDPVTLGNLMGHVDASMMKVYAHLDQKPDYLREAAEKAVKVRSGRKPKPARASEKARKKRPAQRRKAKHPKHRA